MRWLLIPVTLCCLLPAALLAQELMPQSDLRPAYFEISGRLKRAHWFPRVQQLSLAERRNLVMREAKTHAEQTQAEALQQLGALALVGEAADIRSNWLGNFVRAKVSPMAFLAIKELGSVQAAHWIQEHEPSAYWDAEEGAPVSPRPKAALAPSSGTPGDGPVSTRADELWCLGFTGQGLTVMNLDGGVDVTHQDLATRLWTNPGEIPANNIDEDGNGKIDDVYGWNFSNNDQFIQDLPGGHGVRTSGCLVADGTCTGVIYGQAPGARLMTGKITGQVSGWDGLQYAIAMGADAVTSSFSYPIELSPNYSMHRDIADTVQAAGLLRTNSTSNTGGLCSVPTSPRRRPFNISAPGCTPAPWRDPNQLQVGGLGGVLAIGHYEVSNPTSLALSSGCGPFAWNWSELLVNFPTAPAANWDVLRHNDYPWNGGATQGLIKPDLIGPSLTTTTSGGPCGFVTFSGSSNATPNVMGVFLLWKSANPSLTPEDIAMIAHSTAADVGTVPGKENGFGAGRVDAREGLDLAACVLRANGSCAYETQQSVAQPLTLTQDTAPGAAVIWAVGTQQTQPITHGGILALGGQVLQLWSGTAGSSGDASLTFALPPTLVGISAYVQAFADGSSIVGGLVSSNVIRVNFVP